MTRARNISSDRLHLLHRVINGVETLWEQTKFNSQLLVRRIYFRVLHREPLLRGVYLLEYPVRGRPVNVVIDTKNAIAIVVNGKRYKPKQKPIYIDLLNDIEAIVTVQGAKSQIRRIFRVPVGEYTPTALSEIEMTFMNSRELGLSNSTSISSNAQHSILSFLEPSRVKIKLKISRHKILVKMGTPLINSEQQKLTTNLNMVDTNLKLYNEIYEREAKKAVEAS